MARAGRGCGVSSWQHEIGPYAIVPEWHLSALFSRAELRSSVGLRVYLWISVRVSGRSEPWWIKGGTREIARELGADRKDVQRAIAALVDVGIVRRIRRKGTRGHLADAFVVLVARPKLVENPADNTGSRGGKSPPPEERDVPPTTEGVNVPPTTGRPTDLGSEDLLSVGSPPARDGAQDAPPGDRRSAPGLSEEEEARLVIALGDLEAIAEPSALVHDVGTWCTTRIRTLAGTSSDRLRLCRACGAAHDDRGAWRCLECGAHGRDLARWSWRDVVDGTGRVAGWVVRPARLLADGAGSRGSVAALERAAARVGLWS